MAATVGLTIAWSGSAAVCFAVVVIAGLSVRSFWRYEPAPTADPNIGDPGHRWHGHRRRPRPRRRG